MSPVAQRQSVWRPVAHGGTHTRRCRPAVLPLATASPDKSRASQVGAQRTPWGWQLIRATVVATTVNFCATAGQAASASVGGGFGAGGGYSGSGGGGGGGGDGSSSAPRASANVLGDIAEASDLVEEVILLDVGGMKCGGCVGHVKKILESQPGVTSASVNLTTETALVRVLVPRGSGGGGGGGAGSGRAAGGGAALAAIGDKLAQVLTKAGFESRPRAGTAATAAV